MSAVSEGQNMADGDIATLAGALGEVTKTMKSVHSVFIRLAIWIPICLALFMMFLTAVIVYAIMWFTSALSDRVDGIPNDVAKALHVQQTQNVNMERPPTNADLTRDVLQQQGHVK